MRKAGKNDLEEPDDPQEDPLLMVWQGREAEAGAKVHRKLEKAYAGLRNYRME